MRQKFYKMNQEMTKTMKGMFENAPTSAMVELLGHYMKLMESEDEKSKIDKDTLRLMSSLACVTLTNLIRERL